MGGGIELVEKWAILASVAGKIPLQGANVFMHIFSFFSILRDLLCRPLKNNIVYYGK